MYSCLAKKGKKVKRHILIACWPSSKCLILRSLTFCWWIITEVIHEKEILNSASLMICSDGWTSLDWTITAPVLHAPLARIEECCTWLPYSMLVLTWTFVRRLAEMWTVFSSAFPDAKLIECSSKSCQAYNVKLFNFFIEHVCLKTQSSDSLVQILIVTLIWWLCCPPLISVLWFC